MRFLFVICLLLLSACQTAGVPTSDRLEAVRAAKEQVLGLELAEYGLELGAPVFIRVFKRERRLEAWVEDSGTGRFVPFKAFDICHHSGELGPKLVEGDRQAPEGFYEVGAGQMNPWSGYHLSFNLGFPNEYDRAYGRTGSLLMIHGGCKSEGCFAMTDGAMEEIYLLTEAAIAAGEDVPVHIFPFEMSAHAMAAVQGSEWSGFWANLQEGYDMFERTAIPPYVGYQDGRYVFQSRDTFMATLF